MQKPGDPFLISGRLTPEQRSLVMIERSQVVQAVVAVAASPLSTDAKLLLYQTLMINETMIRVLFPQVVKEEVPENSNNPQ